MIGSVLALYQIVLGKKPQKSLPLKPQEGGGAKRGPDQERTFIMIKPDGIHRNLVGDIVNRFEQKGFKLVAMKFMKVWVVIVIGSRMYTDGPLFFHPGL